MTEKKDHIIWIKEGGRYRILACYETRQEAQAALRRLRADGEMVRYTVRGSYGYESLCNNPTQEDRP